MLSRFVKLRSSAVGQGFILRRFKSGWADGGDHATHNDLPVPKGDWKEYYSRRNARNNLVLATGIAALATSIYLLFFSGTVTFNFSRPQHWKAEESAECECEE